MSSNSETPAATCEHCGLPVGRPLFARRSAPARDAVSYCCFGCRFAAAVTREKGEAGQNRWTMTRLGLAIFFTMNVMVFTLALWTQDIYVDDGALSTEAALMLSDVFRRLGLIFSAPVLILLGGPLAADAWENLRQGRITSHALLILGVTAAFIYSLLSVSRGQGHVYFDVVCMVLVAVTLGRWLEATGKLKTTEALQSLQKLLPEQARVVAGDEDQLVPLASVEARQLIRVLPGERIPVDGTVEQNRAAVDEQMVTGESVPVIKEPGDSVFAGALNLDGALVIRVAAPAGQGAMQRLVDAVAAAAAAGGREQRLADGIAAWFVPLVIVVAAASFGGHAWRGDFQTALLSALAVTLIACPCALGVATPLALWAALGRASRQQVLFRDGDALTRLASVEVVCFDKTGTLTTGEPLLAEFAADAETPAGDVWAAAAALAKSSTHSLSAAICRALEGPFAKWRMAPLAVRESRALAGRGVEGDVDIDGVATSVCLGSVRLMDERGMEWRPPLRRALERASQTGGPLTCVGWKGKVRGLFVFTEQPRDEAREAIQMLRDKGLQMAVLSGDHAVRAEGVAGVADALGVEATYDLLPEDKQLRILALRRRFGAVAMVGDGVNDAPSIASADVGVAMGCGTDVSRDAADVCLLGNDLRRLPWAMQLARRTKRTIRQNLFWAFSYNIVGMGLAAGGLLNPIFAALAMVGSSAIVLTNSLRLAGDEESPAGNREPFGENDANAELRKPPVAMVGSGAT